MKANVYDIQGKVKGEVELPKVFSTPLRSDMIKRAVLAIQSHNRATAGVDPLAGMRTSAHYHGVRHARDGMMNKEMARLHRIHGGPGGLQLAARMVSGVRKGKTAHPPKPWTIFEEKINKKERVLAIKSAIAATAMEEIVASRNHAISELKLPIVLDDSVQGMTKAKELAKLLEAIGLAKELERSSEKKIRAGRGKMRGRKYRKRIGPLIVMSEDKGLSRAAKNIEGVDCCLVRNLNAEMLAPGTCPGRLTLFTEGSIKKLGEIYGR
jgi:large subunit ribosomal protein L4e